MKSVLEDTKFIMKKYNIKANKSLGQNFLIDGNVIEKIVNSANIKNDDLIIEIGPGLGTLTQYLLEKAGKVVCIELDKRMLEILNNRFCMYNNFEIINNDVLKVDLKELISNEKRKNEINNVKIVANLPYYITTPIIMKLLEDNLDIESITVMVQKEVAERLIAHPGTKNAGAITYSVFYYCTSEMIEEVPNNSFIPEPEVVSEVIKLTLREKPAVDIKNKELLFSIIKCAFMQRRKTLLNALVNAKVFASKEEGAKVLEKIGLDINVRAEQLSLDDFLNIAKLF